MDLPERSISNCLGERPKRVKHQAALASADVPAFMQLLREQETIARLAVEGAILSAARSGEIRGASWSEVDLKAQLYAVPARRI